MGIKNGAAASFSVQSKILPKLKAQILQMRQKNVQEGPGFTIERKESEIFTFLSVKSRNRFEF